MNRYKLWACGVLLLVIAAIVIMAVVVRTNSGKPGDKGSAALNPNMHEHVFGELTPAATLSQATPDITDVAVITIPGENEGLEIIDQNSLGKTSDIEYLKGLTETGAVLEIIDGVTYVDGLIIANKTYGLPSDYVPTDTKVPLDGVEYSYEGIVNTAWDAWQELQAAASGEGLNIYISSGYRSYSCQEGLWNNYAARDGQEKADTYSARAGHSEHQTGWCFDLNTITDAFADTAEGKWVNENCYQYGFIIRYPKGKSDITGYKYESWHLRYVGKELAEELYNGGDWITMEEHFGLTSKYAD